MPGILGEVSAAAQERSAGIEQADQTVTQRDDATQQNAALVEQATAAARSMEHQAGQLADAVSLFKRVPTVAGPSAPRIPVGLNAPAAKRPIVAVIAKSATNAAAAPRPAVAAAAHTDTRWHEFHT